MHIGRIFILCLPNSRKSSRIHVVEFTPRAPHFQVTFCRAIHYRCPESKVSYSESEDPYLLVAAYRNDVTMLWSVILILFFQTFS